MSLWTWVLTALCVAGVVLALAGAIPVLRLVFRLRSRVDELQRARLFTSLESLQLQTSRLQHLAGEAQPLLQRAQAAVAQIRNAPGDSGYPSMRDALGSAGAQIEALREALG